MSYTIGQAREHLIGLAHSGTLNRVRNFEAMCERAANTMLTKVKPLELEYETELQQTVHDAIYNYAVPTYFGTLIDVYPVDDRNSLDDASRVYAETFDRRKAVDQNKISIEAKQGVKFLRINWPVSAPIVLNTMDSLTANGTWSTNGSASGISLDKQRKISGQGSIGFNLTGTGGGIQNTTMAKVDLTAIDGESNFYAWVYLPSATAVTSITARWGNDLTLKFWDSVPQTLQNDGSALAVGWNLIGFPWSSATETGVVDDTQIDSFRLTFAGTALAGIRVDNVVVSLGRYFNLKGYSKYLFQDTSGNWEARPTANSDDDRIILDTDAYQIFLMELLIAMAQQIEGSDSSFDIGFAEKALYGDARANSTEGRLGLYRMYKVDQPDQRKRASAGYYNGNGNVARGRW